MEFQGFPAQMGVYNSGGWVVDTDTVSPVKGGAIVLLDEQFNAVSLRMYNEAENPADYSVKVETACSTQPVSLLHECLTDLVQGSGQLWKPFSEAAATNVARYHRVFRRRLENTK